MEKIIILFLILSILIVGCYKNQAYARQPTQPPPSPSIEGSGCGVIESENQETKVKYITIQAGL